MPLLGGGGNVETALRAIVKTSESVSFKEESKDEGGGRRTEGVSTE